MYIKSDGFRTRLPVAEDKNTQIFDADINIACLPRRMAKTVKGLGLVYPVADDK